MAEARNFDLPELPEERVMEVEARQINENQGQRAQLTLPTNLEFFQPDKGTWRRFMMRLEDTFEFFEIREDSKKKRMLTHYMGLEAYNKLCDRITPRIPRELTYKEIGKEMQQIYDPTPLEIVEIYKFQRREQKEGESCDDFLAALRKLSINCKFGCRECDYLVKALRNQFVVGIRNKTIQKRLLEKRDLTLDMALEIAKAMETSEKGEEVLGDKQTGNVVNKISDDVNKDAPKKVPEKEEPQDKATRKCYRCGVSTHLANKCPQKEVTCYACNKKGHIAKFCKTKKDSGGGEKMNKFEEIAYLEGSLVGKVWLGIKVGGRNMNFEVDSGSPITIITLEDKDDWFPDAEIFPTKRNFIGYNNSQIDVLGYVRATVEVEGRVLRDMNLYVAVGSKKTPLMGREWIRRLNWLNWNQVMAINKISETIDIDQEMKHLKQEFKNVFDDSLGKIVGVSAELKLKEGANPVFVKARSVPFAKREAVSKEIDRLVAEGALQKVNQSAWATPIVAIQKASGKIRLCGDYSSTLNPNLVIDRHPLPTVEELFSGMAGGKKFSKLDLSQAYMQMEVREEDQELLTLNTHKGLFRPTRLMYGVASAVAIWQRVMENLLLDIPGVKVFLDDIRVTGSNDKEHLARLREVLKRLNERNMRVNFQKCEFFADQIEYCGYVIDKNGINKDPKKIEALEKMPRPSNREEVKAYCGAFVSIQKEMKDKVVLGHYDPQEQLVLAVDASPVGVGACLSHRYKDGSEKPLCFASQTLTETQMKYTQVDREARSSEHGNADGLSRLPLPQTSEYETDEAEIVQLNLITTLPVTLTAIQEATRTDVEIRKLLEGLRTGKAVSKEDRFDIDMKEFSLKQGCLVRGERTYIPKKLREDILKELHEGHVGMTKMKMIARSYCWWPKIERDIVMLVSNCTDCQENRPEPSKAPVHAWEAASKPFERIHIDYAGPIFGKWLLIVVDSYSKWPEVVSVSDQTAETTITELRKIFATHGIPEEIVSDQGRQFMGHEFENFCKNNGIIHKTGAPYHPATNGQAERYVRTIKEKLTILKTTNKEDLDRKLCSILMNYRRTPHSSTGESPSERLFHRKIRSRLDLILPGEGGREKETEQSIKVRELRQGDRVAARDFRPRGPKWKFGIVKSRLGKLHYEILLDEGIVWKRHIDQVRKVGENAGRFENDTHISHQVDRYWDDNIPHCSDSNESRESEVSYPVPPSEEDVFEDAEEDPAGTNEVLSETGASLPSPEPLRRSQRARRPPDRLDL
ncbi:uncharacterized protein K02A2.6-like [Lutzomyia longipalpis]|uniref:uncharacterized protein K02A2.6-like n=1 Tax=Lutzomyia longipalpis TaxID=7200 RepID=UPI0024839028|nr:uncharacterized protein K02A2.6-like [Lutzomyia longipalpis]